MSLASRLRLVCLLGFGLSLYGYRSMIRLLLWDRYRDFQHSILEFRVSVFHIRSFRQGNASVEEPILALGSPYASICLFVFHFALALNDELIVGNFDFHIVRR